MVNKELYTVINEGPDYCLISKDGIEFIRITTEEFNKLEVYHGN